MRTILSLLFVFFLANTATLSSLPAIHLTKENQIGLAIVKYSNAYNLDYKFVERVIKAESEFNEWAISKSGALGLMQLKLETAREIYKKIHGKPLKNKEIFEIETNIELGCFYLNYLNKIFNNDKIKVLSAYNAGFGNARKWHGKGKGTKHKIKFKETKDYVSKIGEKL